MRKFSLALIIIGFMIIFLGTSFAAPIRERVLQPSQDGLYIWSTEIRQFLKIDRVVNEVQREQNDLSRRVLKLEQRVKELEQN